MNRTTIFRVLSVLAGGVVLASAGLAAGMALSPVRQAATLVEPLSTAASLISADLPSPTAITTTPLPPPTYHVQLAPAPRRRNPTDGRVATAAGPAAWETGVGTTGR